MTDDEIQVLENIFQTNLNKVQAEEKKKIIEDFLNRKKRKTIFFSFNNILQSLGKHIGLLSHNILSILNVNIQNIETECEDSNELEPFRFFVREAAIADGADGIIVFWPIFRDMMNHHLTDEWNSTFLNEWNDMNKSGLLQDLPIRSQ